LDGLRQHDLIVLLPWPRENDSISFLDKFKTTPTKVSTQLKLHIEVSIYNLLLFPVAYNLLILSIATHRYFSKSKIQTQRARERKTIGSLYTVTSDGLNIIAIGRHGLDPIQIQHLFDLLFIWERSGMFPPRVLVGRRCCPAPGWMWRPC
jgi:hypothetical protein